MTIVLYYLTQGRFDPRGELPRRRALRERRMLRGRARPRGAAGVLQRFRGVRGCGVVPEGVRDGGGEEGAAAVEGAGHGGGDSRARVQAGGRRVVRSGYRPQELARGLEEGAADRDEGGCSAASG